MKRITIKLGTRVNALNVEREREVGGGLGKCGLRKEDLQYTCKSSSVVKVGHALFYSQGKSRALKAFFDVDEDAEPVGVHPELEVISTTIPCPVRSHLEEGGVFP